MAEDCFYGVSGIRFIWHGEWADPELIWNEMSFSYYDLECSLWEIYREECEEAGVPTDDDEFGDWVREHKDLVFEQIGFLAEACLFYSRR